VHLPNRLMHTPKITDAHTYESNYIYSRVLRVINIPTVLCTRLSTWTHTPTMHAQLYSAPNLLCSKFLTSASCKIHSVNTNVLTNAQNNKTPHCFYHSNSAIYTPCAITAHTFYSRNKKQKLKYKLLKTYRQSY